MKPEWRQREWLEQSVPVRRLAPGEEGRREGIEPVAQTDAPVKGPSARWKYKTFLGLLLVLCSSVAVADPSQPATLVVNLNAFRLDPNYAQFATSLGLSGSSTAAGGQQCADGLECVFMIKAWGGADQNGNPTLLFVRGNGTAQNPQALMSGNIIAFIAGQGYFGPSVLDGSPGVGTIQLVATSNWSPTVQDSSWLFYTQHTGTAGGQTLDAVLRDGIFRVANGFWANGTPGVSCSGPPTPAYTVVGGIVTAC